MNIDFCSDLHVDAWHQTTQPHDPARRMWTGEPFKSTFLYIDWALYKNPESQVLVIAGDISNNVMVSKDVVVAAAAEYEFVVVVDGNHDHYDNDMSVDAGQQLLATLLSPYPNVYYLKHDSVFAHKGVAFFGAVGWYDFKAFEDRGIWASTAKRAWHTYSNDSRYPDFSGRQVESLAAEQAINMAEQVRQANDDDGIESIVLVTHMSPRADIMEWKPSNTIWNALTPSYVNTEMKQVLDADSKGKIRYWIYGHTHTRQMIEINGVVYANNARGYPRENPPFTLTQIEVPTK